MIYTEFDAEGNIILEATDPIEIFALRQWENLKKQGKVKLLIRTGKLINLQEVSQEIAKNYLLYKEWLVEREKNTLIIGNPKITAL